MSSPYGYAPQPQQPSNNGAPRPAPAPAPASAPAPAPPAGGYSQQPAGGYGYPQPPQQQAPQPPQYGYSQPPVQPPVHPPYPPAPQQGYYPAPQGQYNEQGDYNTTAILGLVFTLIFWPVGLVLSIIARNEIDKKGGKGKGLTTASFIICGIYVALFIFFIIMALLGAGISHHVYTDPYTGYSYSSSDNDYSSDSGEYATLKEWYDNSSEARDALADFKEGCEKVGPTDISTVGTDTLEVRITIDDLDDDSAKEIFTEPVQKMFALDAHTFKEHISGSVKFHVIGQNDQGQTYFDETYQG